MAVENFQGALRTYLLEDSTISSLIGVKLYAGAAPQNASMPYMLFHRISTFPLNNISGFSGMVIERWQFDSYSDDIDELERLRNAVFDRLHSVSYSSWSNYKIILCLHDSENYFNEPSGNGTQEIIKRIQMDFKIKRSYETTT